MLCMLEFQLELGLWFVDYDFVTYSMKTDV